MRKLLLQSASKKEQEIQQIGSVAESTIPQPAIEQPIHEEVVRLWPFAEAVIKRYIMERFRLTILAESRIRWKMYVRFGGEYWETYLGNKTRRRVLSLHNQVVKVVNSHFSNVAIPHQIAALEQRMRELKAFSIKILNLAKQAKEWLRI